MTNPLSKPEPWSLVATGYQSDTMPNFIQYCEKAIEMAELQPDFTILDVACGPGTLSLLLHDKVSKIHSIDFAAPMLQLLNNSVRENNIENIEVREMDGQHLEFKAEKFDRSFSMFGLMFFPDRIRGFKELHRVLKPGGRAVVSSWAAIEESPVMRMMFGAMHAAFPEIPESRTKMLNLENPDQFKKEMTDAGFVDVTIEEFTGYWQVNSIEEFLDSMIKGSVPIVMMKSKIDPELWSQKVEAMQEYLRQQITSLPQKLGSTSYIGVGNKK